MKKSSTCCPLLAPPPHLCCSGQNIAQRIQDECGPEPAARFRTKTIQVYFNGEIHFDNILQGTIISYSPGLITFKDMKYRIREIRLIQTNP